MGATLHRPVALACLLWSAVLPAPLAATSLRVLFLGNSLTDGNNVPQLVQGMAQLQGVQLDYVALAPGGYALEDHWADGHQALLEQGDYDVLVLQQGPSTLAESQANLRVWAMNWANEARRFGTQPALYMVWPVRTQANGFALVSQSYRNAALAADAAVFPAGEAWEQVIRADPGIALYTGDNLHATPTGSFLAAMVIARGLVGLEPERVPNSVGNVTVSSAALARFRTVVAAMPAMTLVDPHGPDSPVLPIPPPAPSAPAAPAPSPGSSGGGGAPSGWLLLALGVLAVMRFMRPVPAGPAAGRTAYKNGRARAA